MTATPCLIKRISLATATLHIILTAQIAENVQLSLAKLRMTLDNVNATPIKILLLVIQLSVDARVISGLTQHLQRIQ